MKPVVVIPTYNEKENVEAMAEAVLAILPAEGMILFCDDNSPDGTGAIIDGLCANNPRIKVLHREKKEGLGRAYVAGFARAIADADVVIGSRYVRGGKCVGWPFKRWAISRGGGIFIRIVLGLPVKDPTGGFKCFTRAALETLGDFSSIRSFGYSFQMEMNFRMWKAGLRLKEIPITFAERRAGYSKINGSIAVETLKMVWKLRVQG